MRWLGALLALASSCGGKSLAPPVDGSAPEVAGDGGAPDACAFDGDPFEGSHTPFDLCAVDSDCHNPYLACLPRDVMTCQAPESPLPDRCEAERLGVPADLPVCPASAWVTLLLCKERYSLPCRVATDCGPEGFACVVTEPCGTGAGECGRCSPAVDVQPCDTADQCPQGWECYVACPCPEVSRDKSCHPPFSIFHCPVCAPVPAFDGGSAPD